jgi:hypothetical protein
VGEVDEVFVYDPGSSSEKRAILFVSAPRYIITADGVSHLGMNSAKRVGAKVDRWPLGQTAEELDYLAAEYLKRYEFE